jgi:hypothetical protein
MRTEAFMSWCWYGVGVMVLIVAAWILVEFWRAACSAGVTRLGLLAYATITFGMGVAAATFVWIRFESSLVRFFFGPSGP